MYLENMNTRLFNVSPIFGVSMSTTWFGFYSTAAEAEEHAGKIERELNVATFSGTVTVFEPGEVFIYADHSIVYERITTRKGEKDEAIAHISQVQTEWGDLDLL